MHRMRGRGQFSSAGVVGALSVAVALGIAGCGGGPGQAPAHPPGPPAAFGPGVPIGPVPARADNQEREVLPAALVDNVAYLADVDVVRVIDTRTAGEIATIRPQLPPQRTSGQQPVTGAPLRATIGGADSVLWPFVVRTRDGATAVELARIDTGTHVATHVVVTGLPDWVTGAAGNAVAVPIGAQGDTVVLDVSAGLSDAVAAVNAVTGKAVWTHDNVTSAAMAGSVVVAAEADPAAADTGAQRLIGLGVADGRPRWVGPRTFGPRVYPAGPNLVGVSAQLANSIGSPEAESFQLLTAADGSVAARLPLPADTPARCLYDQAAVTICEAPTGPRQGGRVVVIADARTGRQLWKLPNLDSGSEDTPLITAAWHGLVYGETTQGTTVVYQAHDGQPAGAAASGPPLLVDDQVALSLDAAEDHIVARRPAPGPSA